MKIIPIVFAFFGVIVITIIITALYLTHKSDVEDTLNQLEEWKTQAKYLEKENNAKSKEIDKLQMEINNLESNQITIENQESICAALENRIADAEKLLKLKQNELEAISNNAAKVASNENEKLRRLEELETQIKAFESRIKECQDQEQSTTSSVQILTNRLIELQTLHAAVLKVEEGEGNSWELELTDKQERFIELIHTIIDDYPEYPVLAKELRKVEWSSVWLPLVQKLCIREGLDRGGIYKITLKKDDKVCYIGQAVSIKERWYTHIKKMLGVEARGNERLYEYRPEDVKWEVVEFKDGNLDEDERYWIDYFKCREIGLNKK